MTSLTTELGSSTLSFTVSTPGTPPPMMDLYITLIETRSQAMFLTLMLSKFLLLERPGHQISVNLFILEG